MRQIGNGLYPALKAGRAQLVEQQGKDNRHREADKQLQKTDAQRIEQGVKEIPVVKDANKMLKTRFKSPRCSKKIVNNPVIFEGNDNARHRYIGKYQKPDQAGQGHKLQGKLPHIFLLHISIPTCTLPN